MPDAPITPASPNRSPNDDTLMDDAPPITASTNSASRPAADVPYNREFEDSVMRTILDPPTTADGLESRGPLPAFLLGRDTVPHHELPLQLDDPRRLYKSCISGIKLTHPTGAYEGGNPEPTEEDKRWTRDFIQQNRIKTKEHLERVCALTLEEKMDELRRRMQDRKEALVEREKVERELKALNDQREVELKAQRSIIEKAKAKKEERKAKRTKLAGPTNEAHQQTLQSRNYVAVSDAEPLQSPALGGDCKSPETTDVADNRGGLLNLPLLPSFRKEKAETQYQYFLPSQGTLEERMRRRNAIKRKGLLNDGQDDD